MITINFYNKIWKVEFEGLDFNYKINIGFSKISNIFEHEETVPKTDLIDKLVTSFENYGFLNPILVTEHNSKFVIADGTHRLFALEKISRKRSAEINCLLFIIDILDLRRSTWNFIFKKEIPIKIIKNSGFELIKIFKSKFQKELANLINGEIQAIIRTDNELFKVTKKIKNRFEFLETVKDLDQILGPYDRLDIIEEINKIKDNFALLAPPVDSKGDIELLIKNKELRRKKGSKTDVSLRPLFFGIPLEALFYNKDKLKDAIINKIDYLVLNKKLIFIKPPLIIGGIINPINYNVLIMDKDLFFNYIKNKEIPKNKVLEKYTVL